MGVRGLREDDDMANASSVRPNLRAVYEMEDVRVSRKKVGELGDKIMGEITVDRLFRYGLPDFFSQLKSVSFIAEFDPFEKYFEDERDMLVRDIVAAEVLTVPLDYTIMEIVFELTIRSVIQLYVVDEDDRWVGTIDKGTLLDNVINY